MTMNVIFDGAKPYEPSGSWIGPGTHEIRLISFNFKKEFEVKFLVEKSDFHAIGSEVKSKWNPYKSGWQGENDRDRAFAFVMQLFGLETTDLVSQYAEQINVASQPASGMLIKAIGVKGKDPVNDDGTPKLDDKGKPKKAWTDVTFYHMPVNTAEAIAAGRTRIEAYNAGQLQQAAATPAAAFAKPETAPAPQPVAVAPAPQPVAVAPAPVAALPGLPGLPTG